MGGVARGRTEARERRGAPEMIQHIGEVLAVIACAFAIGSIIGWIAYRLVDRTDYAFDQRDLTDGIGRLFGIRTPPPVEEPVTGASRATTARSPTPARVRPEAPAVAEPRPEPVRRSEPTRAATIVPVELPEPKSERLESAAKSEAAEDLRKRVQSSTRAIAWRDARDERLRPGESAANIVGGGSSDDDAEPPPDEARAPEMPRPAAESPPRTEAAAPPPQKAEEWHDHDEPWAAAPAVWPMDLRQPPSEGGRAGILALPAPTPDIRLALPPVATPTLAADDFWADDEEASATLAAEPAVPPPAAEDRPPSLDGAPPERDNLRRIKGIGQGFEKRLNQLGIYRYGQIAAWTAKQQGWVSAELGFPGRVERDEWPAQAGRLAKGADARGASQAEVVRDP